VRLAPLGAGWLVISPTSAGRAISRMVITIARGEALE
jgi:hypothetical protein